MMMIIIIMIIIITTTTYYCENLWSQLWRANPTDIVREPQLGDFDHVGPPPLGIDCLWSLVIARMVLVFRRKQRSVEIALSLSFKTQFQFQRWSVLCIGCRLLNSGTCGFLGGLLFCFSTMGIFSHGKLRSLFPKESKQQQSRATQSSGQEFRTHPPPPPPNPHPHPTSLSLRKVKSIDRLMVIMSVLWKVTSVSVSLTLNHVHVNSLLRYFWLASMDALRGARVCLSKVDKRVCQFHWSEIMSSVSSPLFFTPLKINQSRRAWATGRFSQSDAANRAKNELGQKRSLDKRACVESTPSFSQQLWV